MNNIFRLSVILTIVTVIAAFVLGEIYSITKPQIEIMKMAKTKEALQFVMPDARVISAVTQKVPVTDGEGHTLYEKDLVVYYRGYADPDSSQLLGYAFRAGGTGYSSVIETMVAIDTSGTIKKIRIISQKETPGLGTLAENSDPFDGKKWSTRQFEGKTMDGLKVDKDGGEIVSITGATITSRAITVSIQSQLKDLLPRLGIALENKPSEEN